jgi:hypothetical protein
MSGMMLWKNEQSAASPETQTESTPSRLSFRWRLLQAVGAALIALSVLIDWPPPADASLPQTSSFLLVLGVLVFAPGLIADKERVGPP